MCLGRASISRTHLLLRQLLLLYTMPLSLLFHPLLRSNLSQTLPHFISSPSPTLLINMSQVVLIEGLLDAVWQFPGECHMLWLDHART